MPINKLCKSCGRSIIVWSTLQTRCPQCQKERSKAKPPKPIKKVGKRGKQWLETRADWIKNNPPNKQGFWECYLKISPQCPELLDLPELTIDHVIGRGRAPGLRLDHDNLKPACGACNSLKGSNSLEYVREKYGNNNRKEES